MRMVASLLLPTSSAMSRWTNNFILDQKPPYMVPAVTMQIEKIPLNQNQKVNKKALPKPVKAVAVAQQQTEQAPLNLLEQELHEMVAGIIGNTDFGITTVLGYAGLTSISAIKLAIQVNKRYGITLNAKSLVKNGTLQSIENEIWRSLMDDGKSKMEDNGEHQLSGNPQPSDISHPTSFPLSYAQTGVYFDCLKNPILH